MFWSAPLLPKQAKTGRPRKTDLRTVIDALRYMVRSGCERRMLFRTLHDLALMLDRLCNEREVLPSAGIVDSQSVKAPEARTRGYDANKKLSGRKRHISVDTDGRLLAMNLTPADIADSTGTQMVLDGWDRRARLVLVFCVLHPYETALGRVSEGQGLLLAVESIVHTLALRRRCDQQAHATPVAEFVAGACAAVLHQPDGRIG